MQKNKFLKTVCLCAMLTAIRAVIGIVCKNFFTWAVYYRVTFENLPVIFAGFCFGPLWGLLVGVCADAVSCLSSANPAINPVISLGAATVGLLSGALPLLLRKKSADVRLLFAVASAHLFGQVLIKSIGKMLFFGMPAVGILLGLAISLFVGTAEFFCIRLLLRNRAIRAQLKGMIGHDL